MKFVRWFELPAKAFSFTSRNRSLRASTFASTLASALAVVPYFPQRCDHPGPHGPPEPPTCNGPCPLRVNPAATSDGSGATWDDARNDLQAALDAQASRGGGEVWVLGGDFPALTGTGGLDIPSKVTLRGGFAGTETTPEQRSSNIPFTTLASVINDTSGTTQFFRVFGQRDVLVERFLVRGTGIAFDIETSTGVRFVDIDSLPRYAYYALSLAIVNSSVRFEGIELTSDDTPGDIFGSDVAFVDSALLGLPTGFHLTNSRVAFDGVDSGQPVYVDETSTFFALDSHFSQHQERGSAIEANGPTAVVGSEFTTGGPGSTIGGYVGSLLVFNSTFLDAESSPAGGSYPGAAVIESGGEVSLSTFYNYWCGASPFSCSWAINAVPNNSLFLPRFPELTSGQPLTPAEYYEVGGDAVPSNCATWDIGSFDGSGNVINPGGPTVPNPDYTAYCIDGGDAALLEQSRQHLLQFADPFKTFPFELDLTRYGSPLWWRSETTRVDGTKDTGAPDPGRHSPL